MSEFSSEENDTSANESVKISGMYQAWFLDYASYVILERAVPSLIDGLKPVQRRILHAMKDLDDGRYTKVANIVGHAMQYHPHGDASIGDAIVQLAQKDLLIDKQGNWGNLLTGDSAAAPRYIEARLTSFALEVVFNKKTTQWQLSYDGRKSEPVTLPIKFPLVLAQGAEGIAVGLSTKILPHNFNELIDASIKHLKGRSFTILPDFPTAGIMDASNYNDRKRGGRIRLRAKIDILDKKTLQISEIPFGTSTTSLIESIVKANEKGKIKVKHIEDNTSSQVEIKIDLPKNTSPDKTIDALYAFTNCELSISPLACVINDDKPAFLGVTDLLKKSTDHTLYLLRRELEIELDELREKWHFASLERIFIEEKIYRDIEDKTTWEAVLKAIDDGLQPHIQHLLREVTQEDIIKLTEIKIKRISKFDLDKAQQNIDSLEEKIEKALFNLDNLTDYAIDYFKYLKKEYGKGKERQTEIRPFEEIQANKVVVRNNKLYVNRKEGFVGTGLKKEEYVTDCSDIDEIITMRENGEMMITKVDAKTFVGKNIIYTGIFKRKDERTVYNLIYKNGDDKKNYVKRFNVTSVTRNRTYPIIKGKNSKILYFTANPNGEAEVVNVYLRQMKGLRKLKLEVDFKEYDIKSKGVKGNLITKWPTKKVELKEEGVSTLKPRKIWFDETVLRLNTEERGELLGAFRGEDRILMVDQDAILKTIIPELTAHFKNDLIILEKWQPKKPISLVYWNGEKERYYVKRFLVENEDKEELIINEHEDSFIEVISTDHKPRIEITFKKQKGKDRKPNEIVKLDEFIDVKGIRALGNQLTSEKVKQIDLLAPEPYEPQEALPADEIDVQDEVIVNKDSQFTQQKLFDETNKEDD